MTLRKQNIVKKLTEALNPSDLNLTDESYKHVGHEGAKEGGGHFELLIVSDQFEGLNVVARHRLVYQVLHDMMKNEIHALSIKAYSPSEL